MIRVIVLAILVAVVGIVVPKRVVRAQSIPGNLVNGNVELMPIEERGFYQVAVKVAKGVRADRAVVVIHYMQDSPVGPLWRTGTSVVDVAPDTFVAGDPVYATRDKIQRIEVTLVKDVESHSFEMQEKK
jgi:hypothetical protein